jgi:hypothetical protein
VLTDCAGKTVTFSKEQNVQKKVSMITLGELCGLPKREVAAGFGFRSRTSYYDSRNAVLQETAADLFPKRTGPHTPSKRTKEIEALIIRTRFDLYSADCHKGLCGYVRQNVSPGYAILNRWLSWTTLAIERSAPFAKRR